MTLIKSCVVSDSLHVLQAVYIKTTETSAPVVFTFFKL